MFLRARKKEEIESRKKEILDSIDSLYWEKSLKDISMEEIAKKTSLSRTSIYSYYESKEEIVLDSMSNHLILVNEELENIINDNKELSKEELVDNVHKLLLTHKVILKFLASIYEVEKHASQEKIARYHDLTDKFHHNLLKLIERYCPNFNKAERIKRVHVFASVIYGFYPITHYTPKQIEKFNSKEKDFDKELERILKGSLEVILNVVNN